MRHVRQTSIEPLRLGSNTTVAQAVTWTVHVLEEAGVASPQAEAEWLLADILHTDRAHLHLSRLRRLTAEQQQRLRSGAQARRSHVPLQQILGEAEFFSLPFTVTPDVLVPRPETEVLVEALVERLRGQAGPLVLDLGTGSGAIAVALAHALPDIRVIASDVSAEALRVAQANAGRNGTGSQVAFVQGDMLAAFRPRPVFHALASNPPYIRSQDLPGLQPEVRDHEPHIALDGGSNGLRYYQFIVAAAVDLLLPDGYLALELPEGAAPRVSDLCARQPAFEGPDILRDLAGVDRFLVARKRG